MSRLDALTAELQGVPAAAALFQPPAEAPQQSGQATPSGQPGLLSRIASDIGTGLSEAPAQVARGGAEAVDASAGWLYDGSLAAYLPEPRSVTGGLINDVTQFATGFVAAGRALRVLGWARGATTAGAIGRGMVQGAIADAGFFDGQEERLSNLVESYPALSNPVTEFLAAKPDDSEAEGRFKNAIEGLVIGGAVEGLIASLRGLRRARNGDTAGAADEADKAGPGPADPFAPENAAAREAEGSVNPTAPEIEVTVSADAPRTDSATSRVSQQRELYARREDEAVSRTIEEAEVGAQVPRAERPVQAEQARALFDLTPEQHREVARQSVDFVGPIPDNIGGIRTDLIEGDQDLARVFQAHEAVVSEQLTSLKGEGAEVITLAQTRALADNMAEELGGNPQLILQRMIAEKGDVAQAHARLLTYRDLIASTSKKYWELSRVLSDPNGTSFGGYKSREELADAFDRVRTLLVNMHGLYKGIQSSYARGLNAMRVRARSSDDLGRRLEDIRIDALRASMTEGNLKGALANARGTVGERLTGSINEYWINSILSGPKTHTVNVISNTATAVFQPAERMIAGAFRLDRREFVEGGLQYIGLVASVKDALRLAGKALWKGDGILDPGRSPVERRSYITAERFNASNPLSAAIIDGLGKTIRLPSRLLTTQDEFFKQLTYRARLRSEAWAEAMSSGHAPGSKRFNEIAEQKLSEAFDGQGVATNDRALDGARDVTFTGDLQAQTWSGGKTLGETLMSATGNHPFLQLVLPFVRTPTNIARWVWDRTPILNVTRRQYFNDLFGRNGSEAAGQAAAKMATGGAMWAFALSMALEGDLTGGGPSDPAARRQLQQPGPNGQPQWIPYAYRVRNADGSTRMLAFDRLDPFGTILGLAADLAEVSGFLDERELDQLSLDMTVALARQLQNKTYLSGLTRALGALAEPERRGERFIYGLTGSFMPSLVNQTLKDDPVMREVRSVVDSLRARAPGSEGIDPVRNILGEPVQVAPGWGPDTVSPIATTTWAGAGAPPNSPEWRRTVQQDVHGEIARQLVIHGTSIRPPAPKMGEVDLREFRIGDTERTAYDRYQALVGEVRLGGKTIQERLGELIRSPGYLRASDGSFDHDGSRVDLIRRVLGAYRKAAEVTMRRELPELDQALRQDERLRALTRRPTVNPG